MRIKPPNKAQLRVATLAILIIICTLAILSAVFPFPEGTQMGSLSIGTSENVLANPDWPAGWTYRKAFNITGAPVGAQSNYTMRLDVYKGTGTDGYIVDDLDYITALVSAGKQGSHDVAVSGNYAFGCEYHNDRFNVMNITDPSSPSLVTSLTDGSGRLDGIHDIVIDGNFAFVTNIFRDSIASINITDPTTPNFVDEVVDGTKLDTVHALTKEGIYIYGGGISKDWFCVINASDPTNMSMVGSVQDGSLNGTRGVAIVGNYAIVVAEWSGNVTSVDISDPTSPTVEDRLSLTAAGTPVARLVNIKISGNYAFITNNIDHRLEVIDISDPSNLAFEANLTLGGRANYILLDGGCAFVDDIDNACVYAIDISDPSSPSLLDTSTNTNLDFPSGMALVDGYLLIGDRDTVNLILTVQGIGSHGQVFLDNHCENDFGDVRFTESDETTEYVYCRQHYASANNATFLIDFDSIPTGTTTGYVYYGKAGATTTSTEFREVISAYSETDPNNHITLGTYNATAVGLIRNEHAYCYGDKGVDNITGFTQEFNINVTNQTGLGTGKVGGLHWGVSSTAGDESMLQAANDGIVLYHQFVAGDDNHFGFVLFDYNTDNYDVAPDALDANTDYYIRVNRYGTNVKVDVFTDFGFTSLNCTLNITCESGAFRYILPQTSAGFAADPNASRDGYTRDIYHRKYVIPTPYYSGWGAEETQECSPSISLNTYSWSVNGGSPVSESSNYATGLTYFTITNNSGGSVTITIGGTDMTGGGYTWDLADDGNPGDMIYGMYAGLEGGDYTIIVKESAPYNTLKAGLADEGTQNFGLKIYTPTNFDDGNNKSGTITLTAVCD